MSDLQRALLYIVLVVAIFGSGYLFGNREVADYRGAADNLRAELGRATEDNRRLKADNKLLSDKNSQLGKELTSAIAAAEESERIAEGLRADNNETSRNLDAAGKIVDRITRNNQEIRAQNSQTGAK